ncbi:hypothetical protein PAAG_06440 [Paracoccidioides lutzii Pb01]|uniref:Uncharacterized protein n=1 Tax=Paracoccidioides lutzii (strain ATCC MYA-826 / Pb01) TaxID=502779 RepID=C1H6P9_PARBA|nr:hypothetical protein PAAG_06440 [Paracoccidioides lutzii Pb01]EEH35393.2 hypothetical protein PAAG_06440 [Paracoccidioides lutzii Pb01]
MFHLSIKWDLTRTHCNRPPTHPRAYKFWITHTDILPWLAGQTISHITFFTSWESEGSGSSKSRAKPDEPRYIGFNIKTECVRIRTLSSPDKVFPRQLNLDGLLDFFTKVANDIFVCGRVYGGSRVAVVSTARYNPTLDGKQNIDREHNWPASHCQEYVNSYVDGSRPIKRTKNFKFCTGEWA